MEAERGNFEKNWQEAFDDAYIFPPARVWTNVEKTLPQANKKRRPLWWYYAAAGMLAALLIGGLGWQLGYRESQKNLGHKKNINRGVTNPQTTDSQSFVNEKNRIKPEQEIGGIAQRKPMGANSNDNADIKHSPEATSETPPTITNEERLFVAKVQELAVPNGPEKKENIVNAKEILPIKVAELSTIETNIHLYNFLENKHLRLSEAHLRFPRVSYRVTPPIELSKTAIPKKKWIGATLASMAFDPILNIQNSSLAASLPPYAYNQTDGGSLSSQAPNSFNIEVRGGRNLSKHWFAEMGASYLRGNSTLNNTTYFINRATSSRSNILSGYFENTDIDQSKMAGSITSASSANSPTSLLVPSYSPVSQANNYQFVSVPIKIGYALFPEKKVQVALIAGVSGDIFLKNTIEANGLLNAATYTSADGVYRSLNFSGQMGVRTSMKLANHWLLTIDGQFRKMMNDLIENTPSVQSNPQSISVGFGANYQF